MNLPEMVALAVTIILIVFLIGATVRKIIDAAEDERTRIEAEKQEKLAPLFGVVRPQQKDKNV
jgi:hypothetical protein